MKLRLKIRLSVIIDQGLDYFFVDLGRDDDLELILLQNNKEIPKNPDFRHEREGNTWEF